MIDNAAKSKGLILVADNEPAFANGFRQMLVNRGYDADVITDIDKVAKSVAEREYDLVTLDLDWGHGDKNGVDVLRAIQAVDPLLPVVMLTGQGSIPTAIEATKLGAFDYLDKLAERDKTMVTIGNAIESGRLKRENRSFLNEIRRKYEIIGSSPAIGTLREQIQRVGPSDSVVLITGESGTGKELVARQIHYHSRRREAKFVCIDSGTLADTLAESELFGHRKGAFTGALADRAGLVEEAEGGTLFLDEITNASLALQAKLLHLIQEREYRRVGDNENHRCNIRIVAASNQDLGSLVKDGKFREDLLYRLKVIELELPPLRARKQDIPVLAAHFTEIKSRQCNGYARRLAPEAVNLLLEYQWPGNVRELENTIERIVILSSSPEIGVDELKAMLGNFWIEKGAVLRSLDDMTREFRRECIIKALNLAQGRVVRAAEVLQIDRTHLYKLINEYQLKDIS